MGVKYRDQKLSKETISWVALKWCCAFLFYQSEMAKPVILKGQNTLMGQKHNPQRLLVTTDIYSAKDFVNALSAL